MLRTESITLHLSCRKIECFQKDKIKWSQLQVVIKLTYKECQEISNALGNQEVTLSRYYQINSEANTRFDQGLWLIKKKKKKSQIFDVQTRAILF